MPLTEEIRRLRVGRIGASRVPDILGVGYRTPDQLLKDMIREYLGEPSAGNGINAAMEHGRTYEAEALTAYEHAKGVLTFHSGVLQTPVIHPEYDWLIATPDAWVGPSGLVEIICPYRRRMTTIQAAKYVQIQVQLAVTGQEYCDWVCYYPGEEPLIETQYPEPDAFEDWLPALKDFHRRFLEAVAS